MGVRLQPCNSLLQPLRLKIWGKTVPNGMRLGSTCDLPYCGNPEHFCLVENKNSKRESWTWLTKQLRDISLGQFVEVDIPKVRNKLHMAVSMSVGGLACFSLRTSADGKKIKIYKVGSWENHEAAENFRKSLPVLFSSWGAISDRAFKHPVIFWFGMLGGSTGSTMHRQEAQSLIRPCEVKGCPFPRNGGPLCHRHEHFFDYVRSMRGQVDKWDLFKGDDGRFPVFSTMQGWEISHSFERTKFFHRGSIDRGVLLSDKWWTTNVQIAIGGGHWSGPQGHKGWGKKKIRKAQRMRPAGYHGSRPSQKPLKVERETLDDIPMWAPEEKGYARLDATFEDFDEIFQDQEQELEYIESEERDYLAQLMQDDFTELDFQ